jgi:hypothetical protein
MQDCLSQFHAKGLFGNNIYRALEYLFQIQFQANQIK